MQLELRRVIIFSDDLEKMAAFYGEVLGLAQTGEEPGWVTFAAGAVEIALHRGGSMIGRRPPKLAFFAEDVAAVRDELAGRGARMGRLLGSGDLVFCDGKDPDGNPFQVSNRA
jgi:catechol 2,3-dioxygenase-like lactoylglutathione lyase family enzyme